MIKITDNKLEINNKILIVDDEPKNIKILKIRLANDYEVKDCSSGEEALETLKEFDPGLILLDIMMPGINGYDLTKLLKNSPDTKNIKIILLSGKGMIDEKLEGYNAGADDYMSKPFNSDELKAKIKVFLKLFNLESQLACMNESLETVVELRTEQILKSERLTFVGLHAAQIVHNLQNPLAISQYYIERMLQEMPEKIEILKLKNTYDRILTIVKNVLGSLGKDLKEEMEVIGVNDCIDEELGFLSISSSSFEIEITKNYQARQQIYASESHIKQVLGNILKNALEAMYELEVKKVSINTRDIDGMVEINIKDEGPGISADNLQKIFEPLYTTKDGKNGQVVGNGLGLAYCRRIIENYGGTLSVYSEIGNGTEVIIMLPVFSESSRGDNNLDSAS